jgi:cation:H+ antiporter
MGTSAPEVAVSVDAALVGNGDIAVANVVGSNLFNVGIVLGGIALVTGVRSSARMVRRDAAVMVGSVLVVLVMLRDLRVARLEGAVLLVAFAAYLVALFSETNGTDEGAGGDGATPSGDDATTWLTPVSLLVGLGVVVGGAHLLVGSAVALARAAGLSEWVIGETVVAVGTSTPEIVASAAAARRGAGDIAAGNLIGSNVFNALFVLGVASALRPLRVAATATGTATWLLALSALTALFLWTSGRLGRVEGVALVAINLGRWLLDLL